MDLIVKAKEILSWFGPIASLGLAILLAYGMVKWAKRLGFAFLEMGKSPFTFIFMLIIITLVMIMYFKFIHPILI